MELPAVPSVMVLEGLAAAAKKAQAPLTAGLQSFQVVTKSPGGTQMIADKMELFDHMVLLVRGDYVRQGRASPERLLGRADQRPARGGAVSPHPEPTGEGLRHGSHHGGCWGKRGDHQPAQAEV